MLGNIAILGKQFFAEISCWQKKQFTEKQFACDRGSKSLVSKWKKFNSIPWHYHAWLCWHLKEEMENSNRKLKVLHNLSFLQTHVYIVDSLVSITKTTGTLSGQGMNTHTRMLAKIMPGGRHPTLVSWTKQRALKLQKLNTYCGRSYHYFFLIDRFIYFIYFQNVYSNFPKSSKQLF